MTNEEIERELAALLNDFGLTVDSCHPGAAVMFTYEDGAAWARCAACHRTILSIAVDAELPPEAR